MSAPISDETDEIPPTPLVSAASRGSACAVVSTQRHVRSTVASFLRWHLEGARFDHVYLYFDSPEDDQAAIAVARGPQWSSRVTVIEANDEFREREHYSQLPSWGGVASSVKSMVQSRQRLNCEHCLRLCATSGIHWLLHIDSDELFLPASGEEAPAHFARLEARGCWQFTYRNLEAVPAREACGSADDYFAHVSLFKQHEDALPTGALEGEGTEAHAALKFWLERAHARVGLPVWFFFYSNGKSAIRVDAAKGGPPQVCAGVHGWAYDDSEAGMMARRLGWQTNIHKVVQRSALRTFHGAEGAVVLHYACCTTQSFAGKDWAALGYLGGAGGPWANRWHQMQTEGVPAGRVVSQAAEAAGARQVGQLADEHTALFGLTDAEEEGRQVRAGVLVRVDRVRALLSGVTPQPAASAASAHAMMSVGRAGMGDDGGRSSSEEEEEEEEAIQMRVAAHARREARRARWAEAADRLVADGYAIVDDFLGADAVGTLRQSVLELHRGGAIPFVLGKTGGGRDGRSSQKYAEAVVRGDEIAVLDGGDEARVAGMSALLRQADEMVATMAKGVASELRRVVSRSHPMLACYPGHGAKYVRHLDNPGGAGDNGRILTLLAYLNPEWQPEDGGVLRLHRDDGSTVDVEPLLDRVVIFWSDERTPHEVTAAQRPRWAISAWYHQTPALPAAAEQPVADAEGDVGGGGLTDVSFGRSTEEVESFLLTMLAMKGGETAGASKGAHYKEQLKSW